MLGSCFRFAGRRYSGCIHSLWIGLTLLVLVPSGVHSQESEDPTKEANDLASLSIEQLLDVQVTSVSKKKERRQDAAAAIYVITSEDIRRSPATNIPDLLRTVPGVSVARLTANTWSITARGFGGRFSNKLLVLIDGRSIYTPLFSGVYWEGHDVMLEDIDRIEIIRGPGGTLWGANAVNGVINIVTKKASETQGLLISGGGGTEDLGFLNTRWGGRIRDEADYRLYLRGFMRDAGGDTPSGADADDAWDSVQGGFRADWNLSPDDVLTIQGDLRHLDINQEITRAFLEDPFARDVKSDVDYFGRDLLARWTHRFADESQIELQGYYDGYTWDDPTFYEDRNTFDLQFEHQFEAGDRHAIIWGAGIRLSTDYIDGSEFTSLDPKKHTMQMYSVFMQDEITLLDELHLIVGTKLEYNDFTGVEVQPNLRLRWTPNERHTVWAAVSRAVRTPSRAEMDIRLRSVTGPGTEIVFTRYDNRDFESEDLLATELGYRVRATETLAIDIAGFFNRYTDFRSLEPGPSFVEDGVTVLPIEALNEASANTFGVELALDWAPRPFWQIRTGYTYLHIDLDVPASDPVTENFASDTPEQQFFLENRLNLPHNLEFDTTFRFVDVLSTLDVDSYLEMDARLAWRPREDLEIAIVGQNLLDSEHSEFAPTFVNHVPSQVERGVYAKLTWKFQPGSNK